MNKYIPVLLFFTTVLFSQNINFEIDPYFKSFEYTHGSPYIFFFSARKVDIEFQFPIHSGWKSYSIGLGGSGSWHGNSYDGYFMYTGKNYHVIQMDNINISFFLNGGFAYNVTDKKFATYNEDGLKILLWKVFFLKGGISDIIFGKDTYMRIYVDPYIGFGGTINL